MADLIPHDMNMRRRDMILLLNYLTSMITVKIAGDDALRQLLHDIRLSNIERTGQVQYEQSIKTRLVKMN